ncbi:MAG: ATP-binding protein [Myxococcota bacterium]
MAHPWWKRVDWRIVVAMCMWLPLSVAYAVPGETLRIAIDRDFAPYEFLNSEGRHAGYSARMAAYLERAMDMELQLVVTEDWGASVELAMAHDVDLLLAASETPARTQRLMFSDPYMRVDDVIVARSPRQADVDRIDGLESLEGERLAYVAGQSWGETLSLEYPGIELVPVPDVEAALRKMGSDPELYFVGASLWIRRIAQKQGVRDVVSVADAGKPYVMHVAIRNDRPDLLRKVNTAIGRMPRSVLPREVWIRKPKNWTRELWLTILVAVPALLGLILLGQWNRTLSRRVDEATAALRRQLDERVRTEAELAWLNETLERRVEKRTEELALAVDRAETAARAKSEFLANMSHEIRTPLNGVLGMVHLLLADETSAPQRERLTLVQGSARSLLGILDGVLDVSKLDAGRMTLILEPTDLARLTREVTRLMATAVTSTGVEVTCIVPEPPCSYAVDRARIRQILRNLVGNALKFTEEGSVTVRLVVEATSPDRHDVLLSVEDTGIGMAPDEVARVFHPFEQADASTSRRFGGTGLGLTIVSQLVDLMGGHVSVQSTVGAGSCFTVRLPLSHVPLEETPERTAVNCTGALPLEGVRVLLAEDNRVNQLVAQQMLEKVGASVTVATDGIEAVRAALKTPFDVVLMDCQMPRMDGYAATRELRQHGIETPVVALTANVTEQDRRLCLEAGMNDHMHKPIRMNSLVEGVLRWMQNA